MALAEAVLDHELVAYAKVDRSDGRVEYFRIRDGVNESIDEFTYLLEAENDND